VKYIDIKKELIKEYTSSLFDVKDITKIPSGIFVFDYLTRGGIPEGKITTFWGIKSSSKTTTALRIINNYLIQNPNMLAAFMDFEATFNKEWTSHYIKNMDRLVVVSPDYGEEGVNIMKKLGQAEDIGLVVVDSIATMNPIGESDSNAMESTVGLHSKLINRMFRIMCPLMGRARKSGRDLTLLLINQPTYDIGKRSFQPILKKVGGIRQELMASLDVRFYTKKYDKSGDSTIRVHHTFSIEKSKTNAPKQTGEYIMYLCNYRDKKIGEVDELQTVINYGKKTNLIVRDGTKWIISDSRFDNLAQLSDFLTVNKDKFNELKNEILKSLYNNSIVTDEITEGEE
jgi:recombination protein RecA